MADRYVLNLIQQTNGNYEVHKEECSYFPRTNFDELGKFYHCSSAVVEAKHKHPSKKINGCYFCVNACHTS